MENLTVEQRTRQCTVNALSNILANNVADGAKQRAVLLSVCGAGTYQLIHNLVAPDKATDKSFAAIVKLVQDHYTPSTIGYCTTLQVSLQITEGR